MADETTTAPSEEEQPARPKTIVFICPKCERKLNGPASLQGKPGQCPHCGTKFRIPVYDVGQPGEPQHGVPTSPQPSPIPIGPTAEAPTDELDDLDEYDEEDVATEDVEDFEGIEELEEESEVPFVGPPPAEEGFFPPVDAFGDEDTHPMARLFAALWQERQHGAVVELHLGDGITILPDWWAERLSYGTHAVFALQVADGSYVMEAISWDSVKRVTVRRISELPDGVFS